MPYRTRFIDLTVAVVVATVAPLHTYRRHVALRIIAVPSSTHSRRESITVAVEH
jgi:hypothetical protein